MLHPEVACHFPVLLTRGRKEQLQADTAVVVGCWTSDIRHKCFRGNDHAGNSDPPTCANLELATIFIVSVEDSANRLSTEQCAIS